jgi:uncharacterized RDD family membrane protein YckC
MTTSISERVNVRVTGRRVVATLLDGLVLGLAYGLVAWAFGTVTTSGPYSWTAETSTGPTLLYALGAFAYFALMEGYLGQTLGKMAVGVRVVDEQTGQVPGPGKAALRTVLRLVDGLLCYLVAFVVVLVSPRRQRIGDMAAHTLVVRP